MIGKLSFFIIFYKKITYKKTLSFFKESVKTKLLITIEFYHDKFNFKLGAYRFTKFC